MPMHSRQRRANGKLPFHRSMERPIEHPVERSMEHSVERSIGPSAGMAQRRCKHRLRRARWQASLRHSIERSIDHSSNVWQEGKSISIPRPTARATATLGTRTSRRYAPMPRGEPKMRRRTGARAAGATSIRTITICAITI